MGFVNKLIFFTTNELSSVDIVKDNALGVINIKKMQATFSIASKAIHSRDMWGVFSCTLSDGKRKIKVSGEWPCRVETILIGTVFTATLLEHEYNGHMQYKIKKGTIDATNSLLFVTCQQLIDATDDKKSIRLLVDKYNNELPLILNKAHNSNTELVCEGITKYKMRKIMNAYSERANNILLQEEYPSIPTKWISLIKDSTAISENPYFLYDKVDANEKHECLLVSDSIFNKLECTNISIRIQYWLDYVMENKHRKTGNYWFCKDEIIKEIYYITTYDSIEPIINKYVRTNTNDNTICYERHAREEELAAHYVKALMNKTKLEMSITPQPEDMDEIQYKALLTSLNNTFSIITGKAGTGKTTVIKNITSALSDNNIEYILCAPTGKAAVRIKETSGQEACTIHALMKTSPKEAYFIIDESSMLSVSLFVSFMISRIDYIKGLILVGDHNQLPSIDPGAVSYTHLTLPTKA